LIKSLLNFIQAKNCIQKKKQILKVNIQSQLIMQTNILFFAFSLEYIFSLLLIILVKNYIFCLIRLSELQRLSLKKKKLHFLPPPIPPPFNSLKLLNHRKNKQKLMEEKKHTQARLKNYKINFFFYIYKFHYKGTNN